MTEAAVIEGCTGRVGKVALRRMEVREESGIEGVRREGGREEEEARGRRR